VLLVVLEVGNRGSNPGAIAFWHADRGSRGAGVLVVGTSDETGSTSLGAKDVYVDPLAAMASMTFDPSHAIGFWLRSGYSLVDITPTPRVEWTREGVDQALFVGLG
jgi:hypothetical protein